MPVEELVISTAARDRVRSVTLARFHVQARSFSRRVSSRRVALRQSLRLARRADYRSRHRWHGLVGVSPFVCKLELRLPHAFAPCSGRANMRPYLGATVGGSVDEVVGWSVC